MGLSGLYCYFAFRFCEFDLHEHWDHKSHLEHFTLYLRWINFGFFTVLLIVMGLIVMNKLKQRFYGLYKEYGCQLWTAVITNVVSMFILTVNDILVYYWKAYADLQNQHQDVHYVL